MYTPHNVCSALCTPAATTGHDEWYFMQRTGDRKWHICVGYSLGGIMLMALPAASDHSIVVGFIVLTLVIVFSLCPNGPLLALASAGGEGPALPLNLAVVRTTSFALHALC